MESEKRTIDNEDENPKKKAKVDSDVKASDVIEKKEKPSDGGTLLMCGSTNWDLIGRKELPKGKSLKTSSGPNLWSPHTIGALKGVRVKLVAAGCTSVHSVVITDVGQAFTWGRNEKGQCGHEDTSRKDVPTAVEGLKNIVVVGAACGRNHTLFVTEDGVAYSCGENKMGQCGLGNQQAAVLTPTQIPFKGHPVSMVSCGAEFSVILDKRGHLYSFGLPEYGQLGHNTDGRYFATSNKVAYDCETSPKRILVFIEKSREGHIMPVEGVEILQVACGINHVVACDSRHRCFSWGFGGYGRLGHAEPKDEMVPRLIKYFEGVGKGVKKVYAGSTYSLALGQVGTLFLFGQTKRGGEANMYPKPVQDLGGWNVRTIGTSMTSIVLAADDSVISWGPSPCYGELGHGEFKKSTTTATEMKALEGLYATQVACGLAHSLIIVRNNSEQEAEKIAKLPEFNV